jgi:hypothetical protein
MLLPHQPVDCHPHDHLLADDRVPLEPLGMGLCIASSAVAPKHMIQSTTSGEL